MYISCRDQFVHRDIVNFMHLILCYVNVNGNSNNLGVVAMVERIVKIEMWYFCVKEYRLGCGVIVQVIRGINRKRH